MAAAVAEKNVRLVLKCSSLVRGEGSIDKVNRNWRIDELKNALRDVVGIDIPVHLMRVIYRGERLNETDTIVSKDIQDGGM